MKPIVIYLDKHDDEIKLTRKEFEEYINKAYDQGYNCGYADGKKNYWTPYWYNTITSTNTNNPLTIDPYTPTKTTPTTPNITWTCSNTGTVDDNIKFQAAKFDDTEICINMGEVHNAKGD